jgi:hypothetical protein
MKTTKIQKEKIELAKKNDFQRTLRLSRVSSDTTSFSAKVDSITVELFRYEVDKFNESNPYNKIRVGKVIEELLYNWTIDLTSINREEEARSRNKGGDA